MKKIFTDHCKGITFQIYNKTKFSTLN